MFGKNKKLEIKVNDSPVEGQPQRLRSAIFDSHHYSQTKRVSFCTIIESSDEFLMETLAVNLQENHRDRAKIEFVVLIPKGWKSLEGFILKFGKYLLYM